ncbi:MAG: CRISPR-associated endonuclease Cas2 [Candidatus Taylorbacteria bacterium]|nr:CRISPR-associated endonuclease Cas2 [Candidatus Taylorbacteria bacterium]
MKKGHITLYILQTLGKMAVESLELCEAILIAGYGASPGRIRYVLRERQKKRSNKRPLPVGEKELVLRYQKLISKLKHDGLIAISKNADKTLLSITARGKDAERRLKLQISARFPLIEYPRQSGEHLTIVAFDVPQKEKRKRDWLREALKHLGLKMVQKSFWMGRVKIPQEFLDDLYRLRLIKCVEIFQVGQTGTLRPVI